jgi:GntR family transcriptional regulator
MRDLPTQPSTRLRGGATRAVHLERSSSVPLYFQLAEILKERIEGGRWNAGDRFPSERDISEEFGVSRTVIRPALDLLESDGQLVRIKGRGTFVSPPKMGVPVSGLIRLLSQPRPADLELRILAASSQRADAEVKRVLELSGQRPVVTHVLALVARDDTPVAMCNSFVDPDRAPWLLPAVQETPVVAADARLVPRSAPRLVPAAATVATASVSEWEAIQLQMSAGGLCFLNRYVERVATRGATRPAELARLVYRADACELDVTLG